MPGGQRFEAAVVVLHKLGRIFRSCMTMALCKFCRATKTLCKFFRSTKPSLGAAVVNLDHPNK